jgi:hypothetical protein
MRKRAYRPEVPRCLEDRSLLSGVAGLSANPVNFPRQRLDFVAQHMRSGFVLFARFHDISQLRGEIGDVVVMIPFARVDGLPASINRILNRMQHELSVNVPHAVRSARNDVIAVTFADVKARVRAGDVVVR